jgi:predicted HTH transcriptional regulator
MSQPTQPIQGPPSGASITDTATASILKEINTLETRLRVQDERLMDVIGRIESAQSRRSEVRQREPTAASPVIVERVSTGGGGRKVSESDLIAMLGEKPRTSVEIRVKFGISREHAARVLTGLFERNLVVRNDAHKPFVYELTEAGRKLLSSGS